MADKIPIALDLADPFAIMEQLRDKPTETIEEVIMELAKIHHSTDILGRALMAMIKKRREGETLGSVPTIPFAKISEGN